MWETYLCCEFVQQTVREASLQHIVNKLGSAGREKTETKRCPAAFSLMSLGANVCGNRRELKTLFKMI